MRLRLLNDAWCNFIPDFIIFCRYNEMELIQNKYYIVRTGDFATNGNAKLLYGVISSILCIDDYISNNSTDCFTILTGSTIVWTIVELCLHMTNTRKINPMYVYVFDKTYQLPNYAGIILQGFQEGGVITTIGLYYGDRLHTTYSLIHLHLLILLGSGTILMRTKSTQIASKRQINTMGSICFIGSITFYNIMCIYYYPEHIQRQISMFFTMIYFCSIWTFFSWYKGFRTIQVHIKNPKFCLETITGSSDSLQEYLIKPVHLLDTFLILSYDILFEIGIAYLFFYNIFLL
jgi:hypothetical protein